ncbi:hypothetical protein HYFRA_00003137 [Hymenoscyphus fraxineus]|uniref:DNA replication regulator SLD2 n=1 Tax=Hymenoscyphus fraxineus TaxID=746836 RepID=A0A9N9KN68_9HELO|nr:hypothetical protein HYFRA_00003137 [Hymenoscyphus fraxineus]
MQDQEKAEWTEKSVAIRAELKIWERTFAAENNGQKASREDIKKHPEIAAKYKEYNKLRDIISGKIPPPKPEPLHQTPRKRKHEGRETSSSKRQIIQTPSRGVINPWDVDPYDSPSVVRNLFTPLKKTAIGPTPQKDGQVLGLFDLLAEDVSPSKSDTGKNGTAPPIQATPRRSKSHQDVSLKHSRTPASTSKRRMLDAFATPLKNRDLNGQGSKTPSSVSKLHFATPSFLRRDSQRIHLPPVDENEQGPISPQMVRLPRKPYVRGLSSILAGLRKQEDDVADEELDILREMEMEMENKPAPGKDNPKPAPKAVPKPIPANITEDEILVADSQPGFPLGGFDDEAQFDSNPEEETTNLDRNGQPLKVYKKKGQKRTTRRVTMKPTRTKPSSKAPADFDSDDELAGHHPSDTIPETQNADPDEGEGFADSARNFASDDEQSEYTASEGGTRYRRPNQTKTKVMGKDGKIRRVAKKVTAAAHQNFKRLKLRNSGAKGGVAHNSRFRRRK